MEQSDNDLSGIVEFHVGSIISHPKFKQGVVKRIIETSSERYLEIEFSGVGIKKIAESWFRKVTN